MEETSVEESFPVPKRGSYNLDFLDDNASINPFQSNCRLGQSPPRNSGFDENINPFKSKSKLGQSPPRNPADDNFNPFKSSSKMRNSPVPFVNQNYEEHNGNEAEDDVDNLSFDQKRYIEDGLDDDFSDPMFDYGNENAEIIDKDISIATAGKDQSVDALTRSGREQSYDSLEENAPLDEFTDNDFGTSCSRDGVDEYSPKSYEDDDAYDDFEDAESHDEDLSGNDVLGSMLAETDTQLNNEMVQKVKPLALQKHLDEESEELDSLEVDDFQETDEDPVKSVNNVLKDPELDPEDTFPYSDVAENQTEDNEIPPFGQMPEAHPLAVPNLATENLDSASFDDGIPQENLELTEEEIFKKESNEFSPLDVLDNEKRKTEPSDDLSSSMVLRSPNLCEDSGLGDSIVTSGSDDFDKAFDMKSEEGMESLPVTPDVLSDQNLTLSQKHDAGFEDDEDVQPDEIMPEMSQAQSADNDVSSFTDCFSTPDEAVNAGSPSDPSTDKKNPLQNKVLDNGSLSLESERESSISPIPEDIAVNPIKEPTEEAPTAKTTTEPTEEIPIVKKPAKKKLKGKVLKKKSMQPKIPNIDSKELEGEDDIKVLIAEKKMSSSVEMASNINEDASSPVDLIQVHPNKSPPANAKPSKTKTSKKAMAKLAKNSSKEKLPSSPQMPSMNGHQLVSEHSLERSLSPSLSPTPIKCIPRLEKSLSSDSYPEMAPDFGVEDGDAQDIANEGCVPVSDVFNESTTWEMLEKFGEEFKDSDQAPQSVYMKLEPGMSPAPSTGGHALHHSHKGNQPITNGERNARAIHEGNEFMQMTSSEPPSKTPSSKGHRHPAARTLDGKAGGGSAAMKKREIDNLDHVSVSHKEEKFDKDEKETDELEYHDAQDFAPAMGDSWVEQVHNFTEIEDSSLGLSQDSLEGLSWSHTDSGLASDSPHPYGCCFDGASLHVVDYDPDSDSGVAVDTSPAHHHSPHAANGTESIVHLVPDPAQQTNSSDPTQVLKYSQSEWNKMKQEQELEFQTRLLQKEKDWSKKLAEKERRITDQEKRIMLLDDQARNLKQSNEDMRLIVAEFEKTIAQLQAEKEKTSSASQESLENLIRERDQAIEDLQSVETAFSDLHRRYEKTKNVVEGFKKNEDILKKCVQDYQLKIKRAEQKLLAIRQQAEEKLEQANTEIDKVRRSTSGEIAKLEAALKKSDIQVQALERTIDQKTIENQELTNICDELIAKVGDVS